MPYLALIGRILFSSFFLISGVSHFTKADILHATNHGLPMASVLSPLAGLIICIAGLSILLGFKARWGAWLLILFLIPATFIMHKFWKVTDPVQASFQQGEFMKNIAMMGGAFLIAYFGSGPFSLEGEEE
jgi:putative oxidoreductase